MRMRPLLLVLAALGEGLHAQPAGGCLIEPFRGAASPQGADAKARMLNKGQSCTFQNYGVPEERANPAESGRVLKEPTQGRAVFNAPAVTYTPNAGFVGTDSFEYEAFALNRSGSRLRLLVRVTVEVTAP